MAHQLTAEVWAHLEPTPGLDAVVLRHILAKLSEASSWKPKDTLEYRLHFIAWVKTVIDHQRAILQATDGVTSFPTETSACLLISQDLIFIALSALLGVKRKLFPPDSLTTSSHICCRVYILGTILCGIRLLSLRNEV